MKKLLVLPLLVITTMLTSIESKAQKVFDFVSVDKVPSYPGGMKAFYQYLGKNIKFPEAAKNNKTQGKVFVSFIVETTGELKDINVIKSLSKETDAEAIRVLQECPKWNPGVSKGESVRVKYNMAINFNSVKGGAMEKKSSTGMASPKTPQFPGGQTKLYSYLAKTIKYPKQAQKNNVQGKVLLSFYVEKDGSLTDVKVIKSLSKETDAEALRTIKGSPKRIPGINALGKAERTKYDLPINFTLS